METKKKRLGYCRDMARKVLKETLSLKVPTPLEKIVEYYDFHLAYLDQPADKFSGILHRGKKAIGINKNHHPVRQRFSLAHELGHYFLDHPAGEDILPDEFGEQENKIYEIEANEFAGELLVARALLKEEFKKNPNVDALTKRFNVSQHVIIIQITKHGLLNKI